MKTITVQLTLEELTIIKNGLYLRAEQVEGFRHTKEEQNKVWDLDEKINSKINFGKLEETK